jgi:D-proline reductase (dithiol) PrdB
MPIDGFRFLDPATRKVMRAWHDREPRAEGIPWTEVSKRLAESRVALISTAGIARLDDTPFDQESERRDPWWGDPTHRVIPGDLRPGEVHIYHLHIDPRPASEDLDCILPLRRLHELAEEGTVGSSAPEHYSIMGYILQPRELVEETAPKIAKALSHNEVDFALLVPV